jgi:2-polyprenyl-6-methoxyphenol hydroxylase-like FAD-dependent oxidoreductase
MRNRNVLISGASIAGPALAYWLRRHGFSPTVVERAPALRDGGYKVDVRGVAVGVLAKMGILAEVAAAGTDMQGGSMVDAAGKTVVTMPGDVFGFRNPGDLEILRSELAKILYARTRDDAEYVFGDSITAVTQTDDGAEVEFERGAPRRFDLVIGADGLHSNVRGLCFGDEARYGRELGNHICIFTVPNHLKIDRWELIHRAPGKVVNVYSARGDRDAKALFIFSAPPLGHLRGDVAAQQRTLAEVYAGVGWETPRLLAAMADAPDFYFDSMTQIVMPRWSDRRVALLGDAAYCPSPASGQGTSLALVGAYVLAGELAAAGGDPGPGFAGYEARMRGFVEHNQRLGQEFAREMIQARKISIWFQNQMMRMLPYLPWKNLIMQRILDQIGRAANAIELRDYPLPATCAAPRADHAVAR